MADPRGRPNRVVEQVLRAGPSVSQAGPWHTRNSAPRRPGYPDAPPFRWPAETQFRCPGRGFRSVRAWRAELGFRFSTADRTLPSSVVKSRSHLIRLSNATTAASPRGPVTKGWKRAVLSGKASQPCHAECHATHHAKRLAPLDFRIGESSGAVPARLRAEPMAATTCSALKGFHNTPEPPAPATARKRSSDGISATK